MSSFGNFAEAELIAASSKSQRIALGLFPAASKWFRISEKDLSYVIHVILGSKPKIQVIVLLLILAWMVYSWKNIYAQTLKVLSQDHSPKFARSWTAWSVPNIKIWLSSPWSLSKSKNCSPFSSSWYSRGNTGISALISRLDDWCLSFLCCLIVLPKFSLCERFAMVVADIFANSLAMMRCGGSSDVSAVSLILLFTLVNWTLICEGGLCSFNCSITLSPKSSLIFALYWPFLLKSHSYERTSFTRSFWKTYINPFLIIFCYLFCEDTNSINSTIGWSIWLALLFPKLNMICLYF